MNNRLLNALKGLLVTLITTTAITGISLIDDLLWNTIIAIIGTISYVVVSFFYSTRLIVGKESGKETYVVIFIVLLIVGTFVYNGIIKVEQWIISLPIVVKILIPSVLILLVIIISIIIANHNKHNKQNKSEL